MTQAIRTRQSLYYVVEVTPGTTPDTPTMIEIPIAGTPNINVEKDTFASQRIAAHAQTHTLRHGVKRASGDIPVELAYGDFDALFESALRSSFSTNVLKVGTTPKFMSLERRFPDVSEYQLFKGNTVNGFEITAQPNGMISTSFSVIGFGDMTPASSSGASADTAATGNEPFDGFSGTITEGGGSANVTGFTLRATNNFSPVNKIGSAVAAAINYGMFEITGEVTAFFESEALINKFLAETESALALEFTGITGGDLSFTVPALKYTGATIAEADEGLIVTMPFTGYYDGSAATSLTITRTPAS